MPLEAPVISAVLLYSLIALLPGAAVLSLAGMRHRDAFVLVGVAVGLSLALQPLVFLWSRQIGLELGRGAMWVLLIVSGVVFAASWRRRSRTRIDEEPDGGARATHASRAPRLVLGVVVVAASVSRWWVARDLVAPLWGDSVHHAMIVDLFTSHGGLVSDWLPLAELSTFTYHFGLHAYVAAGAFLTGLPAHKALLVGGQVLSVLGIITSYSLAAGLTRRPWAGVGAAVAAGGLSTMPAYYLNWGRYTQLAGQVILPAACLLAVWASASLARDGRAAAERAAAGRTEERRTAAGWWLRHAGGPMVLASLTAAGLALTHYLVALFYGAFILAWLVVGSSKRERLIERVRGIPTLAVVGLGALVLMLPWLGQFAEGPLGEYAVRLSTSSLPDPKVAGVVDPSFVWGRIDRHLGWSLVAATTAAVVWGVIRRLRLVRLGLLWGALLVAAAYPWAFGLDVTGVVKDFTVAIGLYVPAGLVVGGALADAMRRAAAASAKAAPLVGVAIAIGAAALAIKDSQIVQPGSIYVTSDDAAAAGWIRANTPESAVFLVSTVPAYGESIVVGQDAGWWLPLLARRATTAPPATVGTELSIADYRERLNLLSRLWHEDFEAPATRTALQAEGVTHAYVGPRAREMDELGRGAGLAGKLSASSDWVLVYDEGQVQVYEFGGASE